MPLIWYSRLKTTAIYTRVSRKQIGKGSIPLDKLAVDTIKKLKD
ncbi:MAG: hypothetical protein AB1458_02570 [Bacteroidota bacterium]